MCFGVYDTCCSLEDQKTFRGIWENEKEKDISGRFLYYEQVFEDLLKQLVDIELHAEFVKYMPSADANCKSLASLYLNFKLKQQVDSLLKMIKGTYDYAKDMYKGFYCSICDAKQQIYFTDNKVTVSRSYCREYLSNFLPYLLFNQVFLPKIVNLASYFESTCNGIGEYMEPEAYVQKYKIEPNSSMNSALSTCTIDYQDKDKWFNSCASVCSEINPATFNSSLIPYIDKYVSLTKILQAKMENVQKVIDAVADKEEGADDNEAAEEDGEEKKEEEKPEEKKEEAKPAEEDKEPPAVEEPPAEEKKDEPAPSEAEVVQQERRKLFRRLKLNKNKFRKLKLDLLKRKKMNRKTQEAAAEEPATEEKPAEEAPVEEAPAEEKPAESNEAEPKEEKPAETEEPSAEESNSEAAEQKEVDNDGINELEIGELSADEAEKVDSYKKIVIFDEKEDHDADLIDYEVVLDDEGIDLYHSSRITVYSDLTNKATDLLAKGLIEMPSYKEIKGDLPAQEQQEPLPEDTTDPNELNADDPTVAG